MYIYIYYCNRFNQHRPDRHETTYVYLFTIDVVQFLECLHDVKLPLKLENIRDNLLVRSKDTLTMFVIERIGRPASPEPYLNMNATGSKGLMAATLKTETELQEYVGAEEYHEMQKPQQQQDYYETFQGVESTNNTIVLSTHETIDNIQNKGEEVENTLMDIYANFSATETKSKCKMCGPLYRKEGKKLFVFEQYRACWVGKLNSLDDRYRCDQNTACNEAISMQMR